MMPKFSINYQELSNSVDKKFFKLSDVEHRLEKVAFDVVRFKDGNPDELWQIQNADDGDYIVAKYDAEDAVEKIASTKWDVLVSQGSGDINIFYKGHPITKVASSQLGISSDDLTVVKKFLPAKLASDKAFVKALFTTLDESSKQALFKLYPELL